MKKSILIVTALVAFFLTLPAAADAFNTRTGNTVTVGKDEVIDGNFYTAGTTINIDGRIIGDLFCAGQSINIRGAVDGSVFCAGQNINLDGRVGGSARMAASTVNITGQIGENVNAFAASVNLSDEATVGWDLVFGAASTDVAGKIGKDLNGGGANVNITGEVGRNAKIMLENNDESQLTLGDEAIVGGKLEYWSKKEASVSGNARVEGGIEKKEFRVKDKASAGRAGGIIFSIFSSLIIGLVLVSVFRKQIVELTDIMLNRIGASIGIGFLALILAPFVFIILMFTVIGIPLSLILLALWIIALYVSKTITAIFLGRVLVEKYWSIKKESLIWSMIIGVVIVGLFCYIPFIGWLLCLVSILWALGALVLYFRKARNA